MSLHQAWVTARVTVTVTVLNAGLRHLALSSHPVTGSQWQPPEESYYRDAGGTVRVRHSAGHGSTSDRDRES